MRSSAKSVKNAWSAFGMTGTTRPSSVPTARPMLTASCRMTATSPSRLAFRAGYWVRASAAALTKRSCHRKRDAIGFRREIFSPDFRIRHVDFPGDIKVREWVLLLYAMVFPMACRMRDSALERGAAEAARSTSVNTMRPPGPVPAIVARSILSSRARRRAAGDRLTR